MSIPDPTIDPITGLPILDTSGIVQQIPLGYQTADFASWNATAHPTRSPLFPDDGYPVFSNVQGQHPLTGNAQSVETDGEHRLKVAVSGGSGGGSSISPNYSGNFTNQVEFSTNTDYFFDRTCAATDLLYKVRVSCELDVTNSGSPPDVDYALIWFFLATATPVPVFNLGSLHLVWNGATGGSTTCGVYEETFPVGLSIADMGFAAGNDIRLYYQTVRNAPWRLSAHWMWKL